MSKLFESTKILHLEITDVCQAACPQCGRETDDLFDKNKQNNLTICEIQKLLPTKLINNLDKMYMCGNYGDPAAGDVLEIIDHFRNINNNITIGMNTNGGLRASNWWYKLAKKLNKPKDYVVFSIDGLEDTNHIYRNNVIWHRVISNAKAFIDAGGLAHWDMLVFEHNKHQVDACQQLAKEMGFYFFRAKVSRRHKDYPVNFLSLPKGWKNPIVDESGPIKCKALEEKSLYVSSRGIIHPCCWTGVINGPTLTEFDAIQQTWDSEPNDICKKTCSMNIAGNSFTNQWQREIQLF